MASIQFRTSGTDGVISDLTRFRQQVTRAKPALEDMAGVVAGAQRDQFDTEGRHYGPGWAPLSPRYAVWKARRRPGRKILVFDGELRAKAAPVDPRNFGVYSVTDTRMEVGVDDASVPYAKYHQDGTKHMPARPIVGDPTREDRKAMTKILHEHIVKGASSARR